MTGEDSATQSQWSDDRTIGVAAACPSFDTLSAYFDGELPDAEMRAIRTHLATCQQCAPIVADFRSINGLLNEMSAYALPRSFAITEAMTGQAPANSRPLAPVTPLERVTAQVRRLSLLPMVTAIAALLLIAVIAGEAWTGGENPPPTAGSEARVVMIGGVPVTVDDDATFGAASAGAMNGNGGESATGADSGTSSSNARNSRDWFNWWRPFEVALGLTVAALIVTMLSRRRPRQV